MTASELDWSNPWIIGGSVVVVLLILLLILILVWLCCSRCSSCDCCCCRGKESLETTTVDDTALRTPTDLSKNNYLQQIMRDFPKAASISQYGKK